MSLKCCVPADWQALANPDFLAEMRIQTKDLFFTQACITPLPCFPSHQSTTYFSPRSPFRRGYPATTKCLEVGHSSLGGCWEVYRAGQ